MKSSHAKSTRKRRHDVIACDVQCKSQRLELCDEQQQLNQTPKITDLDDVCLVKIFNHLNLKDLLNVADANKLLVPAARYAYKRSKFGGTKTVRISACDDLYPNTRAMARSGQVSKSKAPREQPIPGSIYIRHLKWTLLFLRCFGPSITRLSIDYNKSASRRYQYVHEYINRYCAESLTEISFRGMPNVKTQHFDQRPFVNVTCVNIFECHLGEQLPRMVEWFPNLRSMKLSKVRLNHRFVNATFPHLENLEIIESNQRGFTVNDVAALLPVNRQLRNINITMSHTQQLSITGLLDIIRENALLDTLVVRVLTEGMFRDISTDEINRFINEHPALIELDLLFSRFNVNAAIVLHRQLKSLMKLNFSMNDSEYEKLQSNLDNGWNSQSHMNFVTVRRQRQQ